MGTPLPGSPSREPGDDPPQPVASPGAEGADGAGHDDVDRLRAAFRAQLDRWHHFVRPAPSADVLPATDVVEADDRYVVLVELPGVRRDDVAVAVTGGRLQVKGVRGGPDPAGVLRVQGRLQGRFHLDVRLPTPVDAETVTAQCEDGLLTVVVPKRRAAPPRRLAVRGPER